MLKNRDIYTVANKPVGRTTLGKLVLSLAVFVSLTAVFAYIAREVTEGETLRRDTGILLHINQISSSTFDRVALFVTDLGSPTVVTSVAVVLIAYFVARKKWQAVTQIAFGIGGAASLNYILKIVFERQRPHLWAWIVQESNYSFPSGHAMLTAAIVATCILLAWQTRWRWWVLVTGGVYVASVGSSRLYLGVHYPTDIVAGWAIAAAWVVAVATILGAVRWPRYTKR